MPITPLPTPPSRADSANFATRGDAFMAALPVFTTEANALEANVNAKEASATILEASASGYASTATAQAAAAAASATSAAQSIGAPLWISGTTYAAGLAVTSPITLTIFRRLIAGAGVTDPSADATNWGPSVTPVQSGGTGSPTQAGAQNVMGIYAGMLFDFAGTAAPSGYLLCDGAAVNRATYASLFSAIGTTWGAGNGTTTFNLPDLRRRTTIGAGGTAVSGPANTVGAVGGAETHTLTTAELAAHNHVINVSDPGHAHAISDPGHAHAIQGYNYAAGIGSLGALSGGSAAGYSTQGAATGIGVYGNTTGITASSSNNGSGTAHNNMQPAAVVTKIIKT